MPSDVKEGRKRFLLGVRRAEWMPKPEMICASFEGEQALMPQTILEKSMKVFAAGFTYNTQRIGGVNAESD